jgi:hypothetical protein
MFTRLSHFWLRALLASVVVAFSSAAAQPREVSDSTQRAVELVAAAYTDSLKPWWGDFNGFAFDPLGYSGMVPMQDAHPNPEMLVLSSHDSVHVAVIARRFRIISILENGAPCFPVRPDGCRMGSHAGVVAFSPAKETDAVVTLNLLRYQRAPADSPAPVLFSVVTFTIVSENGRWRVARVTVGAA